VTNHYSAANDHGLAFDDPALKIEWLLPHDGLTLSDKDRRQPRLADLPRYFA
jgi:dTDP-4-dehydrorhamnose 3,5-epimerase